MQKNPQEIHKLGTYSSQPFPEIKTLDVAFLKPIFSGLSYKFLLTIKKEYPSQVTAQGIGPEVINFKDTIGID